MNTRQQLTLFVAEDIAGPIENIRRELNPVQFALIKSHITLCREDELVPMEKVLHNLAMLDYPAFKIDLGPVEMFSGGKGVLIPGAGPNQLFHALRALILQGIVENPKKHEPHITLMHPRNSTCTPELFEKIQSFGLPRDLWFTKISLVEQKNGNKWKTLKEFELKSLPV